VGTRPRIVLASASPRRRELLRAAGVEFTVEPVDVDETLEHFQSPEQAALELAQRKAVACAQARAAHAALAPELVLGADTVVAVAVAGGAWRMLGKPADEREAEAMLRLLSGSRHQVLTGVCVVRRPDLARCRGFERTWVTMRELSQAERSAYVASGEWRDKAGGYAIQESADRFVTALEEGGLDNVVGLPVRLTLQLLQQAELVPAGPRG
jgi:septum formation protein